MTEKRARREYLRGCARAKPEATRDWFGARARGLGDRLDFWRFRLLKRAAAGWDWVMWVAEGPAWTLKRKAKERAIAREAGQRPERLVRQGGIPRRAVLLVAAAVIVITLAVGAAAIGFTSGPEDDRAATAGTPNVPNTQPAVPAGQQSAKAADRAQKRRARAHRARIAAKRRHHRAAVARAKRLRVARARARRAAAARRKHAASSPRASTPTPAPRPVASAPGPVPVRSAPAPAPAPKPAPKPQAGILFENER